MSFIDKKDYFGLSSTSGLTLISSTQNASASEATATNQRGDVIASTVYGQTEAPSCEFAVSADVSLKLTLGKLATLDSKKYLLTSITVNTQAGNAPSVTASGISVNSDATQGSTIEVENFAISRWHKAQAVPENSFTLGGTGCALTSATTTISCEASTATKNGEILAHDVHGGKIEVQATIVQTGTAIPTVTASTDWTITSPLTCTNPDSDYPTWTCTLSKHLASTEGSSGGSN